ncbi:hypothetical protein K794_19878 [Salmonella enterica subsp. enterica serovar Newport str. SHSN004]|nr:hypothetical protein G207_05214 [Salmonella enterica subsp. enterica serovar Newport str. Shandong_3]OFB32106.1 hypothetical protein BG484_13495 [Salmonella enterica subsp. enterica serovar Typhimurium]OSJ56354.1 hypothetical protein K794_19878 [Salmonella enterica subsp. enterica serovar Newport str. SHSN004]OSJ97478.1 hypothetical protein K802_16964 [Salmonella enterica subsp. enterica serovar Newport str. SHSN012]
MDYPILMTARYFQTFQNTKIILLNYASNMMVLLPMIKPGWNQCVLLNTLSLDQEEWILISKLMMIPMMNAVRCYHAYLKMHTLKAGHSAD